MTHYHLFNNYNRGNDPLYIRILLRGAFFIRMKKHLYIFYLQSFILPFCIQAHAQGTRIDWVGHINSNIGVNVSFMIGDADGNLYLTGLFNDTCDADPGPGVYNLIGQPAGTGAFDIFVIKVNSQGNLVWGYKLGGPEYESTSGLFLDDSNRLYISGSFRGAVDFDFGPGTFNMTAPGTSSDGFFCLYDTAGNFGWAKQITGSGSDGISIGSIGPGGAIYALVNFNTPVDVDPGAGSYVLTPVGLGDGAVCKYDSSGNFITALRFSGNGVRTFYNCLKDDDGDLYLQGHFTGNMDCDPGPGTYTLTSLLGYPDGFTIKLNINDLFVWAFRIGNYESNDYIWGIRHDPAGNLVYRGSFEGLLDVDPGANTVNISSPWDQNGYVAVIDTGGNFIRVVHLKSPDETSITGLDFDSTGCMYMTGSYIEKVDFDTGPGYLYETSNGFSDFYVSKYDASYNYMWTKALGGDGHEYSSFPVISPGGSLFVMGSFDDTLDFEPGTGAHVLVNRNNQDGYIVKWDPCAGDSSVLADTACDVYFSPKGYQYTVTGQYRETYLNAAACDSVSIMNLVINYSTFRNIYDTACASYTSPSGIYTWTSSGNYNDTLTTWAGCDSIMTFHLYIGNDTLSQDTIVACQRFLSPDSTTWWTTSGTYYDTIQSIAGCDSAITLFLTINEVDSTVTMLPPNLVANASPAIYQWMYCDSILVPNAVNQSLFANPNKWYAVIVTQNGCTDTSACYSLSTLFTGGEFDPDEFSVYPNPSAGAIFIRAPESPDHNFTVELLNSIGQKVYSKENCSGLTPVDISGLESGHYVIVLTGGKFLWRGTVAKY
jgi:hypothetical protein